LVNSVHLNLELGHVSFVVSNIGVPSGGLFIKISLGNISVVGSGVSEFFLVSDVGVNKVELGVVGEESGLSLLNGVVTDGEEFVESLNLLGVNSVGISLGLQEVSKEVVQKTEDLLGGTRISKFLGHLDKSLGEMSDTGVTLKMGLELLDVGLGFLDLSERSTVEETFDEFDALLDGILGHLVIDRELFVGSLSLVSFTGGFLDGGFSVGNELLVNGDEVLKSGSLGVEGVLEMGRSNTESDLGVSESGVDLVLKLEVLGFGPSVFFLFTTHFKVKVSDKVLEGGNELVHWSTSL
jgi:hypothetical protein